jgi:thiamine-monophosphate kinase
MAETLRDRGERALLDEICRLLPATARVPLGPGDDAAVLSAFRRPVLCTIDAQVEHVHFERAWLEPRALGRRAFEVSASDVAAMGGRPVAALLAIAARPDFPVSDLRAIIAGASAAARAGGAAIAGGNLAAARALSITVAVIGEAPARPVRRDGARPGDRLFVTGELGGAALGLRLLKRPRSIRNGARAVWRWRHPVARVRAGLALARGRLATAMIDVSDGLLIDLGRVCEASETGAVIRAASLPIAPALRALPARTARRLALAGGEDYELLFTVPPRQAAALAAAHGALGCRVTHIGEIVRGAGVHVVGARDARGGHQHFAPR